MEFLKALRDKIGDPAYVLLLLGFVSVTFAKALPDGKSKDVCTDIALAFFFLGLLLSVLSLLKKSVTTGLAMGFFDGGAAGCIASLLVGLCYWPGGLDPRFILAWVIVVTPTGAALGVLLALLRPETGIPWREQNSVWLTLCLVILAAAVGLAWSLSKVVNSLIDLPKGTQLSHLFWLVDAYLSVLFVLGAIRLKWNVTKWKHGGALVLAPLTLSTLALYLTPQQVRSWEFAIAPDPIFDSTVAAALLWTIAIFIAGCLGNRSHPATSSRASGLGPH